MSERQLVVFGLGAEEFGIDIAKVREIVRLQNITVIPGTAEFIEGIINLRGQIIPIVNLGKKFGRNSEGKFDESQQRIIVASVDEQSIGILVDNVSEILRVPEDFIEDTPPAILQGVSENFLDGVAKIDANKRFVIVLDISKIFSTSDIPEDIRKNGKADEPSGKEEPSGKPETKTKPKSRRTTRSSETTKTE